VAVLADVEAKTRAAGFGVSRYSDGRRVVNAFSQADAERLKRLGYTVQSDTRFPGRAKPGVFWECCYRPPAAEPEPESDE
jgi:hypothetical protein